MAIKIISVPIVLLITISTFGYYLWYKPKVNSIIHKIPVSVNTNTAKVSRETLTRLKQKALLAKCFIQEHKYNSNVCFLIDIRLPSGKYRFFVYNLNTDSIEISGLVSHGSGSIGKSDELIFSNIPNSNCTSLGKYKIGNAYEGKFGLAYKLYGLDKTNSNAYDRFVVLHALECVPNTICESLGCPTVSPEFLKQVKQYIDNSEKPILLWIYY